LQAFLGIHEKDRQHQGPAVNDFSGIFKAHGGSHPYLVHEFVDSVAADRVPTINVWEAVRYMAAGAVAHKSSMRDGESLEIPDWGDAPACRW
jgi:hypothetical protein